MTQDSAIAKVENWTRNNPDWGWRIYRTRAGLRLLATHALFDPEAAASDGVFDALGADPLYRQLCKTQKCYRARLTPKPWRCGIRSQARTLAVSGRPRRKAFPEMGRAISILLVQLGHVRACQTNRKRRRAFRRPADPETSRRNDAGGIEIATGVSRTRSRLPFPAGASGRRQGEAARGVRLFVAAGFNCSAA